MCRRSAVSVLLSRHLWPVPADGDGAAGASKAPSMIRLAEEEGGLETARSHPLRELRRYPRSPGEQGLLNRSLARLRSDPACLVGSAGDSWRTL